jgi:menaquinone-dependent protoporphyrinogen oxidase
MDDAKDVAHMISLMEDPPPVWIFSSGPIGEPPKPEEDPIDIEGVRELTGARDHQVFAGKLDRATLGFAERAITLALRSPEGDFRDWPSIEAWSDSIAGSLLPAPQTS